MTPTTLPRVESGSTSTAISAEYATFPLTFQADTPIVLDLASPLYTYLNGSGEQG
jgi:hypothetical protein